MTNNRGGVVVKQPEKSCNSPLAPFTQLRCYSP